MNEILIYSWKKCLKKMKSEDYIKTAQILVYKYRTSKTQNKINLKTTTIIGSLDQDIVWSYPCISFGSKYIR